MIKSYALHDIPLDHVAAMERWYYRDHAPELLRRYGPWMSRFECYLPVPAPVDARAFGLYNWRMTEVWWRELPADEGTSALFFTPPKVHARVAACFVPTQPTETFIAAESLPLDRAPLRWLVLYRYPDGVQREEGEEWFLRVHAPQLAKLPGAYRLVSYQVIREITDVPGRWRKDSLPPVGSVRPSWDRVVEFWYETLEAWSRSMAVTPELLTKPNWADRDTYPWVEPFVDFASVFLLERPNDDFLRDLRGYVP